MTFRLVLLASLVLALGTTGCGFRGASRPGQSTLIYAQPEDPKTLDPINTDIAEAVHVLTNLFDTLVTYDDATSEIVPAIAERWEHTPDGLRWTFFLRKGLTFHDERPVDSQAVKFSLERIIQEDHPHVSDKARPYQAAYNMIQAIETPDDHTVVLTLHHPSTILLANLAMFPASIVSPSAVESLGAGFAEHPVGSGPFKFVKWTRDQQLVTAAFDKHWRGRPKIDHLVWVPVKENATRVQRLARGEVHVSESLSPIELDELAKDPNIVVQEQIGMNVAYVTMQMEKPPLDKLKVRQAIYHAINKNVLIQIGYSGHAQPAVSMVPAAMWGHDDKLQGPPFDPARGKALLAEAADEAGFDLPLKLTLAVMNQARPYLQQPAAISGYLKDALAEIGIEVTVVQRDVNQHFEAMMAGRHELGLAGWYSDNSDPDNFLYSLLDPDNISEAGNNLSRYNSPRYHELMLAGQRELDVDKRLEIYRQAQALIVQDIPVVPLVHTKARAAHVKSLQGFQLHPTGLIRLRGAWIEEPAEVISYLVRRLVHAIVTIVVAVALVFVAMRSLPGNPLLARFGQHPDIKQIEKLRKDYGWDRPVHEQLLAFYWQILTTGDLGKSIARTNVSVSRELAQRIPATIELTLAALMLAIPLGIAAGVVSAVWRNRWPDRLAMALSLLGVSIPVFFLGICLRSVLTGLPTSQRLPPYILDFEPLTGFYLIDTLLRSRPELFALALEHILLPAVVLSTIPMAVIARITRSSMLEVLGADYIRTARAKGAGLWRVVLRHALPGAAVPVTNIAGLQIGLLLSGAVLTETVFDWPGLGQYLADAVVRDKDYVAVQAASIVIAAMFVSLNLVLDIVYVWLDPRIRLA